MSKDSETKTRDRNLEEIARLLGRPVRPRQVVIESALDRAKRAYMGRPETIDEIEFDASMALGFGGLDDG